MRRNKLFGWMAGFASVAMAAGTSMAPVLAAVGENSPVGNSEPVEEVVNGEGGNLDTAGQEEPTEADVGREDGAKEGREGAASAAPQADIEAERNLDGAIASEANGNGKDTEMSGVYDFKDNKTTGTVTVVEKWDDQSNNAERPVVDVSLSTTKPSKSPLGYMVTFHADAEKGLTFADGSTENEVVYNSSGQVVSGAYKGLTDGNGVVRWYTDKTYQTQVELNADGTLAAPLTGDVDVWPRAVTFEVKGYDSSTYQNGFNQVIPNTVTTVVFTDEMMPADATLIDVDADGDGGVVAWTEENETIMKVSSQIKGVKVQAVKDSSRMFYNKTKIQTIDFTNFDTSPMTSMEYMFYGCSKLTSLDVSLFDTSQVTGMSNMFQNCRGLTSLDVSSFNTAKVTSISNMFYGCSGLTSLGVSSFNTSKITNMDCMFRDCSGLTSLDLSSFDTNQVTSMKSMFNGCSGLMSLDVSSFDTSKVTDMSCMFYNCSGLTSLDVSSFDTSKVTNMDSLFDNCSKLTSLGLSSFDTSQVTNMNYMFSGCSGLTNLDVSSFDTSRVISMCRMFYRIGLTSLDLSSFDTSKVTNMDAMFYHCIGLTSLDLSSFDTSKVTNMDFMFSGCSGSGCVVL